MGVAESNVGGRLHAARFTATPLDTFADVGLTNDGREILVGRHTSAQSARYASTLEGIYYTCDTNGDSTNKDGTKGDSLMGEIVRYRREQFEAVASLVEIPITLAADRYLATPAVAEGLNLIVTPYAEVQWDYQTTLPVGNFELEAYSPKFGDYLWMGRNDLAFLAGGLGKSESAIPACGIGWHPNDPSADGVTECNNDATGIRGAYQVFTRAATDDPWALASTKWQSLPSYDNYPDVSLNAETMKVWSKQGRSTPANRDTFDVWDALDDPLTTSITNVTIPSGTITSWIHEGTLTGVLGSGNSVYVYDGTSLSQTLSPGSGTVFWWDMKGDWLAIARGATDTHFYRLTAGAYVFHSTLSDPVIDNMLLGAEGVGIDGGSEVWRYNASTDAWEWDVFMPGGVLLENGWTWNTVLDREAVYFKDDRIAYAAIA